MIHISKGKIREVYKELFVLSDCHRLAKCNVRSSLAELVYAITSEEWKDALAKIKELHDIVNRIISYGYFKDVIECFEADKDDIQAVIDEVC